MNVGIESQQPSYQKTIDSWRWAHRMVKYVSLISFLAAYFTHCPVKAKK